MLEKERFLEVKNVAQMIRKENEGFFEALKNVSLEEAIKEKEEFIEAILENLNFSSGEKGKEELQIFRANILIPDDEEFFQTYSKDKNIRSLMNKYYVNIEDIMSKITELNIYGRYSEDVKKDFSYEMTKEDTSSDKENTSAYDLLDEIKSLTEELDKEINSAEEYEDESLEENFEDEFANFEVETFEDKVKELEEPKLNLLEPNEIEEKEPSDDINKAVSSFVDNYTKLEKENEEMKAKIKELENAKNEVLQEKQELANKLDEVKKEVTNVSLEKEKLQKELEESKTLISKIYSCIAPKEN